MCGGIYAVIERINGRYSRMVHGPCTRKGCEYYKQRHPNRQLLLVKVKPW